LNDNPAQIIRGNVIENLIHRLKFAARRGENIKIRENRITVDGDIEFPVPGGGPIVLREFEGYLVKLAAGNLEIIK
jgi:hypothetical protein